MDRLAELKRATDARHRLHPSSLEYRAAMDREEWLAAEVRRLASEPPEKVSGVVTYSQVLLKQYGLIEDGKGIGFEVAGSGYSQI